MLTARAIRKFGAGLLGAALCLASGAALAGFDTDRDGVGDDADTYPCDKLASGTTFVPAQGDHGLILFEDQFPIVGDFDFNDAVVSYNYIYRYDRFGQVVALRATYNILAVGGVYKNGLAVQLPIAVGDVRRAVQTVNGQNFVVVPLPGNADATFILANDLHALYSAPNVLINSHPAMQVRPGVVFDLDIEFANPVLSLTPGTAPYDVYTFRTDDPRHEIHLPQYRGSANMDTRLFNTGDDASNGVRNFVTTSGVPWALHIPSLTQYPLEGVSIDRLYPDIVPFGASGGATNKDFYLTNVQPQFAYRDMNGPPRPRPSSSGPTTCRPRPAAWWRGASR